MGTYKVKYDETCFSPITMERPAPIGGRGGFSVQLSPDQEVAYKAFRRWWSRLDDRLFRLGGYAGTGKSTLVSLAISELKGKKIAVAALTGRAANGIRQKLIQLGIASSNVVILTLHALLYQCFQTSDGRLRWRKKDRATFGHFDLIIVDEASMVGDSMLKHLLSFGVPVFAVGDHGQLPPVGDAGRLMQTPDVRLEKIHRQAEGSAIILFSRIVREEGDMPKSPPGRGEVRYLRKADLRVVASAWYEERKPEEVAFLAWRNGTRVLTNQTLRMVRWGAPAAVGDLPRAGDQVICLKNAFGHVFNGMRGFLDEYGETDDEAYLESKVRFPEENMRFSGTTSRLFFDRGRMPESFDELEKETGVGVESWEELGLLLDYGYCLTVHKAQGSQFDSVGVVREQIASAGPEMFRRWLYTAATRAQNRLVIFV